MTNKFIENHQKHRLEQVTTVMGLIGHLATYIQVAKIFYLASSYAISLTATIISFISMIFWLFYGLKISSKPLIICNIFGLIGVSLIMLGIFIHGTNFW